ncbi:MAG: aldo/keto reductase [Gordonia sp.]|nr:aldo/keto reductase [Gordonia sp. (in: high G+C Gram-positive bacteria)]
MLGDNLSVSALGYGAMVVAGVYSDISSESGLATLNSAVDQGVTFIDTADVYGTGNNEELLSRLLADRRDAITIATKFGIRPVMPGTSEAHMTARGDRDYVLAACDASLTRLGIDTIDLYYMHRRDLSVPIQETVGAMAELVTAGKVRHLGLSEVTGAELEAAVAVHPIAAVQSEWSIWSRDVEETVVPTAARLGVGFVPYSPLGRGFLTGKLNILGDRDFRNTVPRFAGDNLSRNEVVIGVIRTIADELGATAAQVSLAWLRHRAATLGVASVPIPGTRSPARISENIGSLAIELTRGQVAQLDSLVKVVSGARSPDLSWVSQGRE